MKDSVITVPYPFISRDGMTRINAQLWTRPEWGASEDEGSEKPHGIIQIVHGMAEHIARYDKLARFFVQKGFLVCAEDHIGHGLSVKDPSELGHMPMLEGKDYLIRDVHTLHSMVQAAFPSVPYIMYGHSMGSFITRVYITHYGQQLAACVLSGTANGPAGLTQIGEALAHFMATVKGETYRSKFIDGLGAGSYGKKIPNARTPLDWLSTDEKVVDDYIADELSGQMFSVGAYATLLSMLNEVTSSGWAELVPKELPVLFIAGEQDPVGDMGKGVRAAAEMLRKAGVTRVDEQLYAGLRHELHNEPQWEEIEQFVVDWINDVLQWSYVKA